MELKINLNDTEVNVEIKKMVKNHVVSIVRQEVEDCVKEVAETKLEQLLSEEFIKKRAESTIDSNVRSAINPYWGTSPIKTQITNKIQEEVDKVLECHKENIAELVEKAVKDKLKRAGL